jgi:hypothetical protein
MKCHQIRQLLVRGVNSSCFQVNYSEYFHPYWQPHCCFWCVLLPALWLASVCPERLIRKGGSLMRIFRVKSSRQNVALFGLIWFLVFLVTAFFLHSEILKSLFIKRLLYCISYGGLMSALGVFAFLALHPEGANATEKLNADGGDKKPR